MGGKGVRELTIRESQSEKATQGLGSRAGKITGLYCQIILDAIKRKDWREE